MLKATLIRYPDGKTGFASAGFENFYGGAGWTWVAATIVREFNCDEDEVRHGDDDEITVHGNVVATLEIGSYQL